MESVGALLFLAFYFLPTIIGYARHKRNATAILVLNLFLGWTVIGWIVALIWSVTYESPREDDWDDEDWDAEDEDSI